MIINILGENYSVVDTLEKISIADSFVVPQNKTDDGNGEAKLYVGHSGEKLTRFFGERGFTVNCFFTKDNLLNYLNSAYTEYLEPTQEYREKNRLINFWEERYTKIKNSSTIISFRIKDQNQLAGPRLYINKEKNSKDEYDLMRELPLPKISYINIYKLSNNKETKYYFKLILNGFEDTLEDLISNNTVITESTKFIPASEDNINIENELNEGKETIEEIKIPFDPNKIRVRTDSSSINQIIDDLNDKIINLNPEFQRLPNLWDNGKKSRFIESLILKLPIPAFYFNEKEENNLEVVDGLQRISTIKSYILDKELILEELEFLHELEGLAFDNLPSVYQRRIKTFQITTYVIEKGTPNEVKYNIFKRVNTGGLELTAQEIRHAINQGEPSKLIAELVNQGSEKDYITNDSWRLNPGTAFHKATDYKLWGSKRMQDRDFANRFVAFYLIPYHEYEPDLDTFLNNGMAKIKLLDSIQIADLKEKFKNSMVLAYDIFGDDTFRKRFHESDYRKPINKSIFDSLSVSLAKLTETEAEKIIKNKELFKSKFIVLNNDFSFLRAITQGTAQKENVRRRFSEMDRIIKETLEND